MATRQSAKGRTSPARSQRVPTTSPTARPAKSGTARRPTAAPRPSTPQAAKEDRAAEPPGALRALVQRAGGGLPLATLIVSVLGLAVSAYMTYEHFTQNSTLACPANATFNCAKVTTSPQSYVLGIPVAVLGLAFYLFMVAVNSPQGWRARWPAVHWARLASVIVGIVFVLYLLYAELFLINSICPYCTGVHVLTFVLFGLVVTRFAMHGARPVPPSSPPLLDSEGDQAR